MKTTTEWKKELENEPFSALKEVPGDPIFHAEGNVLVHTEMVLDQLEKLQEFKELPQQDQKTVYIAALFHDTGKQNSWQTVEGRVSYPGHSRESNKIFYNYFWHQGYKNLDLESRKLIHGLIACHSWPPNLFNGTKAEKNYPAEAQVIHSSQYCRNDLLHILAKADMLGRISKINIENSLAAIDLYLDIAKALNCLKTPYKFDNEHARYKFLNDHQGNWGYQAYDDTKMNFHMLMGVPGSGKTTYRKKHFSLLPCISLDELRIELGLPPGESTHLTLVPAYARFREILRKHTDCVWDAVNVRFDIRQQVLNLARQYGAKTYLHFVDADSYTCHKGNNNRDAKTPPYIVDSIAHSMQLPKLSETHTLNWLESNQPK